MGTLLSLEDVFKYYPVYRGRGYRRHRVHLKAVDGVSISVEKGASFALAGESGSGKSTIARLILMLEVPTEGALLMEQRRLDRFSRMDLAEYRSKVSAVFQDASGSLNPRMRIKDIVAEPLEIQRRDVGGKERSTRIEKMLELVGLGASVMNRFPHELSGGQKQRVSIARAVILQPTLVVLDEPVSALDVSIRAQVLNLLSDIQKELSVSYFVISHDLATLGYVSEHVGIMYLGRLVESGRTDTVFADPKHPYTKSLIAAMPDPEPGAVKVRAGAPGEIGSAIDLPTGCRYHPRCEYATSQCLREDPCLKVLQSDHSVACHLA